jgi:RIO kinase 1
MKTPESLEPLLDSGLIEEVLRPLMSGKEAEVYVVRTSDGIACAKVYKDATFRSFQNRAQYMEGRLQQDSRQARAMEKGSSFGRQEVEQAWRSAEVEALFRLADAGVRVPKPLAFAHGVLLMELVVDEQGDPAPRLINVPLDARRALRLHAAVCREAVRMLCVGVVHGDLSEYNVLITPEGPVIIDLPQYVDSAHNNNAKALFARDVDHLATFLGRSAPELLTTDYAREIWDLYEKGLLHPETQLTGRYERVEKESDVEGVLEAIADAAEEAAWRMGGAAVEGHQVKPSRRTGKRNKKRQGRPRR